MITEANKLIPASGAFVSPVGGHKLTDTPMGPFGGANKSNTESIFSIENNDVDNAGVNGAGPTMYTASVSGGRGIVGISPLIWNQPFFPANDYRKSTNMVTADGATSPGRGAYFSKKYADPVGRTDNAPIIRYAEVLLNAAEALARKSATVDARALELLNAVRNRAVPSGTDRYTTTNITTGSELVQAILNERRIEFLAEGIRWLDIHRLQLGIPAKVNNATSVFTPLYTNNPATTYIMQEALPYANDRFIWPIPADELASNPGLTGQQNPGY